MKDNLISKTFLWMCFGLLVTFLTGYFVANNECMEQLSEIFNLLAQGKSITDIGRQLHLSVKTVSTHKSRIMNKMGMHSLSEIVRYAIAHNLLAPFEK